MRKYAQSPTMSLKGGHFVQGPNFSADQSELIAHYKPVVLARVRARFSSAAEAELWFSNGRIPGYGEMSPEYLVSIGRTDRVIEAIEAIEAGVHSKPYEFCLVAGRNAPLFGRSGCTFDFPRAADGGCPCECHVRGGSTNPLPQ